MRAARCSVLSQPPKAHLGQALSTRPVFLNDLRGTGQLAPAPPQVHPCRISEEGDMAIDPLMPPVSLSASRYRMRGRETAGVRG